MNPLSIAMFLMANLPKLIDAVRTILASKEAKTIEDAVGQLLNHVTPGGPASPALAPNAPTLVQPLQVPSPDAVVTDRQAHE